MTLRPVKTATMSVLGQETTFIVLNSEEYIKHYKLVSKKNYWKTPWYQTLSVKLNGVLRGRFPVIYPGAFALSRSRTIYIQSGNERKKKLIAHEIGHLEGLDHTPHTVFTTMNANRPLRWFDMEGLVQHVPEI